MVNLPSARSLLTAALLFSAAPLALAAAPQMSSQATQTTKASEPQRLGTPPHADVKSFESAKLSLTQAIADAQKEMRGKTIDARYEVWQGRPAYLIRTYSAHQVWQSRIDANTGEAIGHATPVVEHELGPHFQRTVTALNNAPTTLEQAISDAEQQRGGRAIMASVKSESGGVATYDVDLVKDGRLHTAMIDASTGQLR